jgi:hypothetical protein
LPWQARPLLCFFKKLLLCVLGGKVHEHLEYKLGSPSEKKNLEIIYEIKKPFANLIKYVYFIYKIILDIYQLPKQPCLLNKGMYYFIYD